MIPRDDIKTSEKLGSGGQATVYKGEYAGAVVAVKKFSSDEKPKISHLLHLHHCSLIKYLLVSLISCSLLLRNCSNKL